MSTHLERRNHCEGGPPLDQGSIRVSDRPLVEQSSALLESRLSFKAINNNYLLKDED